MRRMRRMSMMNTMRRMCRNSGGSTYSLWMAENESMLLGEVKDG